MFPFLHKLAPALLAAAALIGCAAPPSPPPSLGLRLAPADLQASLSLQQHLKVERGGRIDELDAALEVDPERLDLVALAFGQRVMSVHYDGATVTEWRHAMLPAQVRADAVLQDFQLTLWPQASLAAALPAGWSVSDEALLRTLRHDGLVVATVRYSGMPRWSGTVVLDNLRYHYRLTIVSVPSP
jgi:hypothetical protein